MTTCESELMSTKKQNVFIHSFFVRINFESLILSLNSNYQNIEATKLHTKEGIIERKKTVIRV